MSFLGIIIITSFITKKFFVNNIRKKRANELDDEFDYKASKERKNDIENKLFEVEERINL